LETTHEEIRQISRTGGRPPAFSTSAGSLVEVDRVGPFELRLLATINILRQEAWGSNLQRHLSNALGRDVAVGQLYLALGKLEHKGFISSKQRDPEPRRGGRSKKVFRLDASGVGALERTAAIVNASGALQADNKESTYGKTSPA
jgi:DNA-binding PadR family transcriptional regulator